MNYEQKYKESLKRARDMMSYKEVRREDMEYLFPELKESEDEKIRKELIDYIKSKFENSCSPTPSKNILGNWIAWLEKQDFNYTFEIKEGHWYKCVCDYMLNNSDVMFKYGRLYYCRRNWRLDGEIDEINVKDIGVNGYKSFFRPVTNQEIKDWLEKQGQQSEQKEINLVEVLKHYPIETELYSPLYGKLWLAEVNEECGIITCYKHPLDEGCTRAILKQEDTVSFYSNGTTGLPDCNVSDNCMLFLYDIEKQGEQKPSWSEDDEENMNNVLYILNQLRGTSSYNDDFAENTINWIKSLKDKLYSNNEYDKDMLGAIEYCIKNNRPFEKEHIAWLEKQGEQKSVNKVEPKFKVGDWITNGACTWKIDLIEDDLYCSNCNLRFTCGGDIKSIDEQYHLWTLQDAKDGDVLIYDDGWTCIFKHIHGIWYSSYCFITADGEFHTGYEEHAVDSKINGNAHPATKEQCDLLFAKIKENGYEWNADEKVLNKVIIYE